ncbi:MAG: protein-export chaperone SecB [Gammaproteobacteria bacterium]|jgi:preprotein translocase subunit SecB|nr:protein-export chaperone SecB [Gammaproteobacteria bacterium]|tara:strand:- start:1561 stop:2034 length:474 start_codon:yes stop_codon:yes gene_type:complete
MSEQQSSGEEVNRQFALQRIYLKDASFESPGSPNSFRTEWKPNVNLELNTKNEKLEGDLWDVVLGLTITAKNEEDEVVYLVEVQQAGIFHLSGFETEGMAHALGSFCPSVLFPYAREVVDSFVVKGSFPPLMLAPVNFDAILEQSQLAQARQDNEIQ